MKHVLTTGAVLLLSTTIASAGGIERAAPSAALLFEDGNYLELNFGFVSPDVSGTQAIPFAGSAAGSKSENIAEKYTQLGFGYKNDLNDRLSIALIIDQPYGADVNYGADTDYAYGGGVLALGGIGSTASIDSNAITALLSYKLPSNFTVYGGGRAVQTSGEVALFNTYTMETSTETDFGYVVGGAWERPDIAARVALTYHSEIIHDFDATEASPANALVPTETEFSTTLPQSVTLEAQTGVAADTLLFGSVRWVNWSEFDISPVEYGVITDGGSLVDYDDDTVTYNVGLGRRFSDEWSGAVTAGYEAANGGFSGNLGPTDGNKSLGVAATRTMDNLRITGGVRYIWVGDTETEAPAPAPEGTTLGEFEDNSGWAAGVRIAYNF
ncbi:MAG: OmpP1/FadL family transporter [Yoonia sp.]